MSPYTTPMLPNVSGQKLRRGDALGGAMVTSGATAVIGMSTKKAKAGRALYHRNQGSNMPWLNKFLDKHVRCRRATLMALRALN